MNKTKFKPNHVNPAWVCGPCGFEAMVERGITIPKFHAATWHAGRCEVCGRMTSITEARDFGHPWSKIAERKRK